jgi:hypothetical protein
MVRDRKRKAPEELSTNMHTVKVRKRLAAMDEVEAQIELAKHNDLSAISYAMKKMKQSDEYKKASNEKKANMEETLKDEVTYKRYVITIICIFCLVILY